MEKRRNSLSNYRQADDVRRKASRSKLNQIWQVCLHMQIMLVCGKPVSCALNYVSAKMLGIQIKSVIHNIVMDHDIVARHGHREHHPSILHPMAAKPTLMDDPASQAIAILIRQEAIRWANISTVPSFIFVGAGTPILGFQRSAYIRESNGHHNGQIV
jgi:hypothetical protein